MEGNNLESKTTRIGGGEKILIKKIRDAFDDPQRVDRLFATIQDHLKDMSPGGLRKFASAMDDVKKRLDDRSRAGETIAISLAGTTAFGLAYLAAIAYTWLTGDGKMGGAITIGGGMVGSAVGMISVFENSDAFDAFVKNSCGELKRMAQAELATRDDQP